MPSDKTTADVAGLRTKCYEAMNDDLSSPIVISHLFDAVRQINTILAGDATITAEDLAELKEVFSVFMFDIMGLTLEGEAASSADNEAYGKAVELLLQLRQEAKGRKDWTTADFIRNRLAEIGFEVKDTKEGAKWRLLK